MAKGYAQQPRIDYNETNVPVVRMDIIKTLLTLAAQHQLSVFQLDVKSTFLNGELKEEVYVEQPQDYVIEGQEDEVYRLRKVLCELKQLPKAWTNNIGNYLLWHGFIKSPSEPFVYIKAQGNEFLILCLYVDNLIYIGSKFNNV